MNKINQIKSKLIKVEDDALLPQRQTIYSIGYDLHANISIILGPRSSMRISTGYKLLLYKNDNNGEVHYAEIRGRSGLSSKSIMVSHGLIDPDYYEIIQVVLTNASEENFKIVKGDRIAQLVIIPYNLYDTMLADENDEFIKSKNTIRVSGFGSTGT